MWRKKPIVIKAFRFGFDEEPEWCLKSPDVIHCHNMTTQMKHLEIGTLEGVMKAHEGDYVIQGVDGEIYPCRSDIFEDTYEWVYEVTGTEPDYNCMRGISVPVDTNPPRD